MWSHANKNKKKKWHRFSRHLDRNCPLKRLEKAFQSIKSSKFSGVACSLPLEWARTLSAPSISQWLKNVWILHTQRLDSLCGSKVFAWKRFQWNFHWTFFFRVYLWLDDKGKKITKTNVSAPQYIDYVMTCCHNYLHDDAVFPTKYGEFKEKGGGEFKKTCREHITVKT